MDLLLTWVGQDFTVKEQYGSSLNGLITATSRLLWLITRHHATINQRWKLPAWAVEFQNRSADPKASKTSQSPKMDIDAIKTQFRRMDSYLKENWVNLVSFKQALARLHAFQLALSKYLEYLWHPRPDHIVQLQEDCS